MNQIIKDILTEQWAKLKGDLESARINHFQLTSRAAQEWTVIDNLREAIAVIEDVLNESETTEGQDK